VGAKGRPEDEEDEHEGEEVAGGDTTQDSGFYSAPGTLGQHSMELDNTLPR
jgi:hypothetical protein